VVSAVIADKTYRRETDLTPDYAGFDAGDAFVAGYGMDAAGRFRHWPDILAL
jgi:hypoxanthine phosphoribosyltransferase